MPRWDDRTPGGISGLRFYSENKVCLILFLSLTFVGSVYLGYLPGREGCKIAWRVTLVYGTESV